MLIEILLCIESIHNLAIRRPFVGVSTSFASLAFTQNGAWVNSCAMVELIAQTY